MDIFTLIDTFNNSGEISNVNAKQLQSDNEARVKLSIHIRENNNHAFAVCLLKTFIHLRRNPENKIGIEELMFASYLVTFHQKIEDCLLIWEAKTVDFDAYCGVDIQLVPFAGVKETIAFLENQKSEKSKKALEYVLNCNEAGDFDILEEYYSKEKIPWWV
ncbi:MAG: hypothetical protein ABL872_02065 [Lacibacter sp.]